MKPSTFKCAMCAVVGQIAKEGASGYAVTRNGRKVCYKCAASRELADMRETGAAMLYLTAPSPEHYCGEVTNWTGLIRFEVLSTRGSRHNIGGERRDVWFKGPDGERWHGVHIGTNNTIVRCKRIKGRRSEGFIGAAR